jgi:glycosyltransferase involved in cell wall biosynthesis
LHKQITVSFFIAGLASNPIGRAAPIGQAIERLGYKVEVLGFIQHGKRIYKPYSQLFTYKTIATQSFREVFLRSRSLASLAEGQIIYAFKPNWLSLLPAALASGFGYRKPLLLDVEDYELWTPEIPLDCSFIERLKRNWKIKWKIGAHILSLFCRKRVTVVSRGLQRKYGGKIILHGPDESIFNTERKDLNKIAIRKRLGLSQSTLFVGFFGIPHEHKGLSTIVAALNRIQSRDWHLIVFDVPGFPIIKYARNILGQRCHVFERTDNRHMPELLTAVDVVVTPQKKNDFTEYQVPAKLLEGMAMARGIIVSRVGDLPELVGEREPNPRGWVVEPENEEQLSLMLYHIRKNITELNKRRNAAREYYLKNASVAAIAKKLHPILLDSMGAAKLRQL